VTGEAAAERLAPSRADVSPTGDDATIRACFEAVVEPLMPDLLRYFARRVAPREDAADCLSDTLLVLWRHRSRMPGQAEEQRAWAYGIARNVLCNHQRKRARRVSAYGFVVRAHLAAVPAEPSPATEAALAALNRLGELDRELVRLVVWDGFGVGEAGRILGMREATARSRYSRARSRLRTLLASEDQG
jgi:RNA polymerase sigma-70 factor (ECF subfamily)